MKKLAVFTLSLFFIGINVTLKSQEMTQEQKMSYALGTDIANSFKTLGLDVDPQTFYQGVVDALADQLKLSTEELQEQLGLVNQAVQKRQREMQEAQMAQQSKDAEVEKGKGKAFLAENKKQKGVVETASGLQYKVVTMGKGAKPTATDKVKVHYHGTLIDGTVFDSSVQRGEPITFPLNGVIAGWTEGVQLMPAGSKFIFYIPSDLAYGDRGVGSIKAGSTLIFEVELLDINPAN